MKKKILIWALMFLCFGFARHGHAFEADVLGGVEIHGFVSQGFLKSSDYNYLANDSRDGSFAFNEMGINFSKNLTDKLRMGVQLFSRDLGDVANHKINVDWAYADYRWQDWLGVRAGRIKIPLGLFNEIRDLDMLRTCIVLPMSQTYTDLLRDTLAAMDGVGVYGHIPINDTFGSIDYQAMVGTIDVDLDSGVRKLLESELREQIPGLSVESLDSGICEAFSILWHTPLDGLNLRTSGLWYDFDVGMNMPSLLPILGTSSVTMKNEDVLTLMHSAEYTWNNLTLIFEFTRFEHLMVAKPLLMRTREIVRQFYVMANYRFNDWFEMGAYRAKDKSTGDTDTALTLRFDINENWIAKLEIHSVDGTANVTAVDNPDIRAEEWYFGAAKVTFSF